MFEEYKKYSSYIMRKKTQYCTVELISYKGIPTAKKQFHSDVHKNIKKIYLNEKRIYINLNGRFRTPRLLGFDDEKFILYIEWIKGDRLSEFTVKRYFNPETLEDYKRIINNGESKKIFRQDQSKEILYYKNQIKSIVRQLHDSKFAHKDLSFRNFIITENRRVYIFDFNSSVFPTYNFKKDINNLKEKFNIDYNQAMSIINKRTYPACFLPDGHITLGDGQESSEQKFDYLGIKDLSGYSVLDLGAAEGEISRRAVFSGAYKVVAIEKYAKIIEYGKKINRLWNVSNIEYKNIDTEKALIEENRSDITFCFSILHHLQTQNDIVLRSILEEKFKGDYGILVESIRKILSITNKFLFLELPFERINNKRYINAKDLFKQKIEPEIKCRIIPLGIWHANWKKDCIMFVIEKPGIIEKERKKTFKDEPYLKALYSLIPIPVNPEYMQKINLYKALFLKLRFNFMKKIMGVVIMQLKKLIGNVSISIFIMI